MRIPNGSYYSTPAEYDLWVLKDNKAVKRKVILGESNYEYVEVKGGLEEGEKVILVNMDSYKNKESLKIK